MHETVEWWEEHYSAIGRKEHYDEAQVAEYAAHIAYCKAWMESWGVLKPLAPPVDTAEDVGA